MVEITFDSEANVMYVRLREGAHVDHTDDQHGNVLLDLDADDRVVGIEILLPAAHADANGDVYERALHRLAAEGARHFVTEHTETLKRLADS